MNRIILGIVILFGLAAAANSHSGGTNNNGCHNDYYGYEGYHCHSGNNNSTAYDLIYQGQTIGRYPSFSQCQNAVHYVARKYNAHGAYCLISTNY